MKQLPAEQQAEVKKTGTKRLRLKLVKAGFDDDTAAELERAELMRMYAGFLVSPFAAAGPVDGATATGVHADKLSL